MNKNSKIYVAGHKGLVGSAISRKLETDGYNKLVTRSHEDLDLMKPFEVMGFFQSEKPEYVFLAAAKVGGIMANNEYPADFIYNNLMIQSNVIHAAYAASVKKLLFLGSSCIYPRDCPQPMKEEYLLSGKLEATNEPYAVAKIAGIKMCQAYNRQYGTNFISAMPTNLYGPEDRFDLENSHVLPALIRKFHLARLAARGDWDGIQKDISRYGVIPDDVMSNLIAVGQFSEHTVPESFQNNGSWGGPPANEIFLWGTGSPKREFMHVDDLANACIFLMNKYDDGEIVNIGTGREITIKDLSELIKGIVGFDGSVSFDVSKPDGTPRKLLDVSRLESLGWTSKISLKQGIEKVYESYLA